MNDNLQSLDYQFLNTSMVDRNRVLRNTYWLLALSMVPTVLGAWLGVATGLSYALSGGLGLVVVVVWWCLGFGPVPNLYSGQRQPRRREIVFLVLNLASLLILIY